jgi:hypothetical protein
MNWVLALIALGLLIFYGWGVVAYWQAASRERLKLLQTLAIWNLLAAIGSFFFLLGALQASYGLLSLIGAGFAIATPFLWQLGRIGPRLRQYGLSHSRIYFRK